MRITSFLAAGHAAYRNFRPFSNYEAWIVFRVAAFGEAIGWTLLIIGIALKRFVFAGNDIPVQIAGHMHGTLFLMYVAAVLVLAPSLRWSWPRMFIAGVCSVPPYGSLLFEMWEAHRRRHGDFNRLHGTVCYQTLLTTSHPH